MSHSDQDTPSTEAASTSEDPKDTDAGAGAGAASEAETDSDNDSESDSPRVIIASPSGIGIVDEDEVKDPTSVVEEPAKVMRLGSMIKQLLEEVRSAPLDEAARERMAQIHERSLKELESGLSPELVEELERITLPFDENQPPSDAELRIAQAQLVGWLEGLFHGIQTALMAQQMATQNQLAHMRKALPPGISHPDQVPPGLAINRDRDESHGPGTGQYL